MKPTMLVCGGDTPLGNRIIQKALTDGFDVAATTSGMSHARGEPNQSELPDESESFVLVPWGRTSPISARNVVLQVLKSHERIDQAIFVHGLVNERKALNELAVAQIDEITDIELKSRLFLVREVIAHFVKRRSGVLSFVVDREGQEELATMDSLVTQGFVALAESLMTQYHGDPIAVNGFDTQANDVDGYASFILSVLGDPDRAGKWFRYSVRGGLFRGGFRPKVKRS